MPRILSISQNPTSLSRNDALALSGYSAASPKEPTDSLVMLAGEHFDAVVIGDSVEPEVRKVLIPALRNLRPDIPILFVYSVRDVAHEPLADVSIDVTTDPVPLVTELDNRVLRVSSLSKERRELRKTGPLARRDVAILHPER